MLNKVMLIGNLGRDPEVRSTPSGQPVANFTLATSRRWKDKNGQRQDQTEWHYIVVWGKQAEIAGQYLTKGKQIFIEGRLQTRSWEDRQSGEKKYRTEVICENFQMLGQRGGGAGAPDAESTPQAGGGGPSYDEGLGGGGTPEDDDIPF
jgi:single-strand DNA-binding protein